MRLPQARGPLSRRVVDALGTGARLTPRPLGATRVVGDEDAQLALWVLYELHYRGFDDVPDDREWDPGVIAVRAEIERRLEQELRRAAAELLRRDLDEDGSGRAPENEQVGDLILRLVAQHDAPPLARFLQRHATREHVLDYLTQHSLQQLKEADPQSFVLPRLDGPAKVALAELQYDEYGGGRPAHLHQRLYAEALEAAGLDPAYGAYVDEVDAASLCSANVMSMFCLQRRLRGAALGHLAAFEASSSAPSRRVAAGLRRLELPPAVAAYFDEHVEADAVHEQVAARDICGSLASAEPGLVEDMLLGAATCLHLDDLGARSLLRRWEGRDDAEGGTEHVTEDRSVLEAAS